MATLQTDPILLALRDPETEITLSLDGIFLGKRYAPGSASIFELRPGNFFLYFALVALHPRVTREVLVWLCEHVDDESVLSCVAAHPLLPWKYISQLARHSSEVVRTGVAMNIALENVPEYHLIVRDPSDFVRDARARHWKLPTKFFLQGCSLGT